jgi:hypothetical protein
MNRFACPHCFADMQARLTKLEQSMNMSGMPFETEPEDILFTIRMALMSYRTSPKSERNEHTRRFQAEAIVERLERAGYRIVQTGEDRGVKSSNIGG